MLWLFVIWPCLYVIVVGCGLLLVSALQRFGGPTFRSPVTTSQTFWFGYSLVILLLQLYSIVLPIRVPALVLLAVIAFAGFVVSRRRVAARLRSWRSHPRTVVAVAIVIWLAAVVMATRSIEDVGISDTHLYHLQVVKWARTYAAVPGIANLHYRLAYNNSIHLFAALTDVFWEGRATHIALGFLTGVVLVQLITRILRGGHARERVAAAFCLLVIPFVPCRGSSMSVSSLSSDMPLSQICIVIVLELLLLPPETKVRRDLHLALLLVLAAVAMATKLNGLALLVVTATVVLISLLRRKWSLRRTVALIAAPALVLAGYFARQAILSGWLFFPAPHGNLHLPWSLPVAETLDQYRWIQSWARIPMKTPAEVLDQGFTHWFGQWADGAVKTREFLILEATLAIGLYRLVKRSPKTTGAERAAVGAGALSLVLWFQGAPDIRFGAVFFWVLFGAIGGPLLAEAMKERAGQFLALAIAFALTNWTDGLAVNLTPPASWTTLPPVPNAASMKKVKVSPGLTVFAPADAPGEARCSDSPLPCTPFPAKQRLRKPGDLGAGFLF
jgi:hypothetical protein